MAFFRKKRSAAEETPAENEPHEIPLTIDFETEPGETGSLSSLFPVLPEYSEIVLHGCKDLPRDLPVPDTVSLRIAEESIPGGGAYTVRTSRKEKLDGTRAAELFGYLSEAREDVLFYGASEKKTSGVGADPLPLVIKGERGVPSRIAYSKKLAQLGTNSGLCPRYRELFIPLLFAESATSLPLGLCSDEKNAPENDTPTADGVMALAKYFDRIKPSLDASKYRFAFQFVCGEFISAMAQGALTGDRKRIRELDAQIKEENMALWVAVGEKSPFRFIKTLRKKNYSLPFYLKAALKGLFAFK